MKIKATTFEGTHPIEGELEDMGLCYVTVITIDGQKIVSWVAKTTTSVERMAADIRECEEYGYYNLEPA